MRYMLYVVLGGGEEIPIKKPAIEGGFYLVKMTKLEIDVAEMSSAVGFGVRI